MSELSMKQLKDLLDDNEIDLSSRQLEVVPKGLFQLPRATNIDLSQNKISSIPRELCSMTNITKLDLGTNRLVVLPDNIGDLVKLQHLNLYNNSVEELPLSFANLRSLKWLDLGRNDLEPALAKAAGNCSTDKECKQAAVNVLAYMQKLQLEHQQAKAKQDKLNQKIHAANVEAEKVNKKKAVKKAPKKEAPTPTVQSEEMTKHHGHKSHHKAPPKAPSPVEQPRGWSFFGFIFSVLRFFIRWSVIAVVCFALCATVALLLDCYKTGGSQVPNSKSFCTDVTKLTKFKAPSDKFVQHTRNAYGSVFNAYKKQFNELTANGQKQFNQFYKTSTLLKDLEGLFYKCHKAVTHYVFYVFSLISDAYNNLLKWYDAEGKKTIGFIVEPIQVAVQMAFEVSKDLFFTAVELVSNFIVRATAFFERLFTVWAEKGFAAAIDAAFKH